MRFNRKYSTIGAIAVGAVAVMAALGPGVGLALADEIADPGSSNSVQKADDEIPGGGQHGCVPGGCGTIGYAWADDKNVPTGQITVNHLIGDLFTPVNYLPLQGSAEAEVYAAMTTYQADVTLMKLVRPDLEPTVVLRDGTKLTVTGFAREGDIKPGQKVCHSGWSNNAATVHETCGSVTYVGPTNDCHAIGTGSSSCVVLFETPDGSLGGDFGDSGAAEYSYNPDGTITLVGTFKAHGGNTGWFEPTYAAMQLFGGHPLTTTKETWR